jgi:hypothetical protein
VTGANVVACVALAPYFVMHGKKSGGQRKGTKKDFKQWAEPPAPATA